MHKIEGGKEREREGDMVRCIRYRKAERETEETRMKALCAVQHAVFR